MPLYAYKCATCESSTERVNTVAEYKANAPECCGGKMGITITKAPYGFIDRPIHYKCPVTNEGVTSKRQRREIMAREGLVSAHEMMQTKAQRDAKEAEVHKLREESKGPPGLREQVDNWASKQLA